MLDLFRCSNSVVATIAFVCTSKSKNIYYDFSVYTHLVFKNAVVICADIPFIFFRKFGFWKIRFIFTWIFDVSNFR